MSPSAGQDSYSRLTLGSSKKSSFVVPIWDVSPRAAYRRERRGTWWSVHIAPVERRPCDESTVSPRAEPGSLRLSHSARCLAPYARAQSQNFVVL